MAGGRPPKYQKKFAIQAAKLCRLGATDAQLADFFEVCEATINNWKQNHPEFLESLKESKEQYDNRIERALAERALGYSHPEDKIFNDNGTPLIVPTTKHYPPDTTAAIFWLKNRRSQEWRDKQEIGISSDGPIVMDFTGLDGDPLPENPETDASWYEEAGVDPGASQ